jgi:hypothetical protein
MGIRYICCIRSRPVVKMVGEIAVFTTLIRTDIRVLAV